LIDFVELEGGDSFEVELVGTEASVVCLLAGVELTASAGKLRLTGARLTDSAGNADDGVAVLAREQIVCQEYPGVCDQQLQVQLE
jgi:hypothetical protein